MYVYVSFIQLILQYVYIYCTLPRAYLSASESLGPID